MSVSKRSLGLIVLLVAAVALAGCSGTSTPPATTGGPAAGGAPAGGASPGGSAATGPVSGASLFGDLSYNWVEYKMVSGSGAEKMTIYFKYDKNGKCSMRFEGGAAMAGMPTEMDCSSTGTTGKSADNPNTVSPDVKFVKVSTESVTVPAGTFIADKYTASYQGMTSTYWIASGKPLLKMEGGTGQGTSVMELNGWG
ncbi:MAG: hypothetical protein OS112_09740 [Methanoregula sp.]|nr:MAG: hypothetical protein OS112_09740 [Methanoregula sp.]